MVSRSYMLVVGAAALSYAALGSVLRLLPEIVPDHATLGLLVGAPALTGVITRPVGGALADRFGPARVMSGGAVLMAAGVAPAFVSDATGPLLVSRLLVGAGEGAMMSACVLWLLQLAGPDRRGQALGHIGLANFAGLTAGPLLAEALGVRPIPVFAATTVLPLAGALCARTGSDPVLARAEFRSAEPKPARRRGKMGSDPLFVRARILDIVGPGLGLMLVNFGAVALLAFGPEAGESALIVPVFAGGVIVFRAFFAWVPDRVGARATLFGATVTASAGLVILALSGGGPAALAGTVVLSVGQAFAVPALGLLALAGVPAERHGATAGMFFAFFDLGVGLGGPIAGAVASATTAAGALVWGAAAVLAAGLLSPVTCASRSTTSNETRTRSSRGSATPTPSPGSTS